jgi:hypothetical protein
MRLAIWVFLGAVISTGSYYLANTTLRRDGVEVQEAVRGDFLIKKGVKLANVGFVRKRE